MTVQITAEALASLRLRVAALIVPGRSVVIDPAALLPELGVHPDVRVYAGPDIDRCWLHGVNRDDSTWSDGPFTAFNFVCRAWNEAIAHSQDRSDDPIAVIVVDAPEGPAVTALMLPSVKPELQLGWAEAVRDRFVWIASRPGVTVTFLDPEAAEVLV